MRRGSPVPPLGGCGRPGGWRSHPDDALVAANRPALFAAPCSMVGMPVSPPFTEADVRLAAGPRSFERGLDYLDAVEDLEISDMEVTASVYGNSEYTVHLIFGNQGLGGSCTCPYGQDGFFCKHCVAVALSVLEIGEDLPRHVEATRAQRQALEAWLQSLSKEELLAELRGLLDEDRELRQRFELRAAAMNTDALAIR